MKLLLSLPILSLSAFADIAPEDSRLVGRTFSISNADDHADKVFIACEISPTSRKPTAAYRIRSNQPATVVGYKLSGIDILSLPAADWPALRDVHGVADAFSVRALEEMSEAGWEAIRKDGITVAWEVGGGPVLTRIGEAEAGPFYVPKDSKVAGESRVYRLGGYASSLTLESMTESYTDGTPDKRIEFSSAVARGLRTPAPASAARLTPEGTAWLWTPDRSGPAALGIYDAGGRKVWGDRRVLIAGETVGLPVPAAGTDRLVLLTRWRDISRSVRLESPAP